MLFIVGIIEILSKLHKLFAVMEPRSRMAKLNKANKINKKYLNNFNFKILMVFVFYDIWSGFVEMIFIFNRQAVSKQKTVMNIKYFTTVSQQFSVQVFPFIS